MNMLIQWRLSFHTAMSALLAAVLWTSAPAAQTGDDFAANRQAYAIYFQAEELYRETHYQEAIRQYEKALELKAEDTSLVLEQRIIVQTAAHGRRVEKVSTDNTHRVDYAPNKKILAAKVLLEKQILCARPPVLSLTWLALREPTHDNVLDGGETGTIVVNIENTGPSVAKDVRLMTKVDYPANLEFKDQILVGDLDPSGAVVSHVKVKAAKSVHDQNRRFNIIASEDCGFNSNALEVSLGTRPPGPARLVVNNLRIESEDNDGAIRPGVVAHVAVRIQNTGTGFAESVIAMPRLGGGVYLFPPEATKTFALDDMFPGDERDVRFSFITNNLFQDGEKIPVFLSLAPQGEQNAVQIELPVAIRVEKKKTGIHLGPVPSPPISIPEIDVDDPPQGWTARPDAVAVVIGNKNYTQAGLPNVDYAQRDASVVRDYLVKTFGFLEKNIIYIEDASAARFNEVFGSRDHYAGRLYNYIKPGESDVFIYYSGHGAPDLNNKGAYFVPVDANPNFISLSGYSLDTLYQNLAQLPARAITVVLDTCFSGNSAGGFLLKNISPNMIPVMPGTPHGNRIVVFTSTGAGQVSSWYHEKHHSLFTYFFLKGLSGVADENQDMAISTLEMHSYTQKHVLPLARKLTGQEQTPLLIPKKDQILLEYQAPGTVVTFQ